MFLPGEGNGSGGHSTGRGNGQHSTSDDVDIPVSQPTVDIDNTRVKFVSQHDGAHDKLLLS